MSFFDALQPIFRILPEVKAPAQKPPLKQKLIWTAAVLIIFFIMSHITVFGISTGSMEQLKLFQTLLASNIGSLMTLGIGPIVLASIILQLLVGGKFINLDIHSPEGRAKFTSLQKLLTIILCFFEAGAYTGFGVFNSLVGAQPGMFLIVYLQIVLSGIIVLYFDEIVSKYGIGSGVGLFIAAGVSHQFFWQVFSPPGVTGARAMLFGIFESITTGNIPIAIALIIPIVFAIIIFMAVTFAEGMHVNIPIAMGPKGFGGRFPIKLMYVSNMPVILAAALFANIQIMGSVLAEKAGIVGTLVTGLQWMTSVPRIDNYSLVEALIILGPNNAFFIGLIQAAVYIIILCVLCVIFGKFWVELGGQGTEAVAEQLDRSGMYIPGFRKDPRIIRGILEKYIPPVVVLGSLLVGLLAGFSDVITGSLVSGTGILLTVGIVYRMYEELAKDEMVAANPLLRNFFG